MVVSVPCVNGLNPGLCQVDPFSVGESLKAKDRSQTNFSVKRQVPGRTFFCVCVCVCVFTLNYMSRNLDNFNCYRC